MTNFRQRILINDNGLAYSEMHDHISRLNNRPIVIICDKNTRLYCLDIFKKELKIDINKLHIIEIKLGERSKSLQTCKYIWDALLAINCDKGDVVINLGGGVVCDIGGFAASVFKRGIRFINVPTTLLAMVDAGIGGKTGIDYSGIKNIIGTIVLPELTLIDDRYLNTLDDSDLKCGFAEMLKHALIWDKNYWDNLMLCNYQNPGIDLIKRSVEIKQTIVSQDLYETGKRKLLNFGHTIGHGIEAYFLKENIKSSIKHGEAVAGGIILESYISMRLGLLSEVNFKLIEKSIKRVFGIIKIPEDAPHDILEIIRQDKKNRNNDLLFVLLKDIGKAEYDVVVKDQDVLESLSYYSQ
ncbi:MAG: 3-dehydroquinate synthase [Prolixibacteraceae bacterium]|nr:3-dehydroquinate synthase [Prolixibacteraceae bacterium]